MQKELIKLAFQLGYKHATEACAAKAPETPVKVEKKPGVWHRVFNQFAAAQNARDKAHIDLINSFANGGKKAPALQQ